MLPKNWKIYYSEDGIPYYYNKKTDETLWRHPLSPENGNKNIKKMNYSDSDGNSDIISDDDSVTPPIRGHFRSGSGSKSKSKSKSKILYNPETKRIETIELTDKEYDEWVSDSEKRREISRSQKSQKSLKKYDSDSDSNSDIIENESHDSVTDEDEEYHLKHKNPSKYGRRGDKRIGRRGSGRRNSDQLREASERRKQWDEMDDSDNNQINDSSDEVMDEGMKETARKKIKHVKSASGYTDTDEDENENENENENESETNEYDSDNKKDEDDAKMETLNPTTIEMQGEPSPIDSNNNHNFSLNNNNNQQEKAEKDEKRKGCNCIIL